MTETPHWADATYDSDRVTRDSVIAHMAMEEAKGAMIPMAVGPYAAFVLVRAMQIVARHPEAGVITCRAAEQLGRQLTTAFQGSRLESEIAEGWNGGKTHDGFSFELLKATAMANEEIVWYCLASNCTWHLEDIDVNTANGQMPGVLQAYAEHLHECGGFRPTTETPADPVK